MNPSHFPSHTQKTLNISGMTCQACATRLEKVLNKKDSVHTAQVNFATETLVLDVSDTVSDEEILAWVKKTGFVGQFTTPQLTTSPSKTYQTDVPYRFIALWVLSVPFWVGMVGMMFGSHALMPPVWVQFVLASVAQFVLAVPFYQGAWAGIRGGLLGMDVLVALSTSVIWAYSVYTWGVGGHVYFEAGVMILAFVSLGKYLEHRTKTGSLNALSKLLTLLPQTVSKKQGDAWIDVPLSHIKVGDVLRARHGDNIAVDGQVLDGAGETTEAHLTGESAYLSKTVGDMVLAGSVVVDGSLVYQAVSVGEQTALGRMTDALAHAQGTKAPIARLADRVAGIFVPVVVGLSVLTFLGNWAYLGQFDTALLRAVAVLVIACPCALGLATPIAIMAGMGVANRHGVQFLDAPTLELTGQITTMAFDKTGTLTDGRLSVVDVCTTMDKTELLGVMASLESHSKHPLAQAICEYAHTQNTPTLTASDIASHAGQGIQGVIEGVGVVRVGTANFVGESGQFDEFVNAHPTATLVFAAVDGDVRGVMALADGIKSDAKSLITHLKSYGITPIILSGDRQSVVDDVADKLGVVGFGELSPQDKADKIQSLQSTHKVAMIGDGINDALAMTTADIGMAIGGATDVATGSAGVRLIRSDIGGAMAVYRAYHIARLTLATIKQNLFFAFIYNIIAIPLAMIGVLNPMLASLAMALSSLSVIVNTLRLKNIKLTTH